MSDTPTSFSKAVKTLVDTYRRGESDERISPRRPVPQEIHDVTRPVLSRILADPSALEEMSADAIDACFELRIVELLLAEKQQQDEILSSIESELGVILRVDTASARRAAGKLVGCLLLAVDEIPAVADRVLTLLGSLTGRNEGLRLGLPTPPPFPVPPDVALDLSKILDYALFGEVFAFLTGLRSVQDAAAETSLNEVTASVIAIASRKGGVGKSTVALALALAATTRRKDSRVCIVDLDITGPTWQYVLCPEGRTAKRQPVAYLNKLFRIEQPHDAFDFGEPNVADVLGCVAEARLPMHGAVGLLTFADWPRTNRYLVQAIANNRAAFTAFLVCILRAVSSRFDLVIIDNTPGFDPHPLITLVLAGRAPRGVPLVVSTEQAPDLRGTFLELSDLPLLHINHPPSWIVNKASEQAERFFATGPTVSQIAALWPGYAKMMPTAPLLQAFLAPRQPGRPVRTLPFDEDLARSNAWGIDLASPLTEAGVKRFLASSLYRRFESDIAPRLLDVTASRNGS